LSGRGKIAVWEMGFFIGRIGAFFRNTGVVDDGQRYNGRWMKDRLFKSMIAVSLLKGFFLFDGYDHLGTPAKCLECGRVPDKLGAES
jgi:hypothetical protein